MTAGRRVLRRDIRCATCGARGELDTDFTVRSIDLTTSVIAMDERRAHAVEIQETAERHHVQRAEIERRAAEFDGYDRLVRPGD